MKPMKNLWLDTIIDFNSALSEVSECLCILKENANTVDFGNAILKKRFADDVMYMKQLFEKGEVLARNRQRKR